MKIEKRQYHNQRKVPEENMWERQKEPCMQIQFLSENKMQMRGYPRLKAF